MKQFIILLLSAILLVGCSQNSEDLVKQPEPETVEFSVAASQPEASDQDTRALIEDFISVVWEEGDGIALYAKSYDATSSSQATLWWQAFVDNLKNVIFRGHGDKPAELDTYYSAYPANTVIKSGIGTFEIPADQDGIPTPLMAAKIENVPIEKLDLHFTPINSTLHITIDQVVDEVIFTSCSDNEPVAGTYTYNYNDGSTEVTGSGKQISVKPAGKSSFLISVPSRAFAKGYRLTIKKGDGVMMQSYGFNSGKTLIAGKTYPVNIAFNPITVTLAGGITTSYATDGVVTKTNDIDGATAIIGGANSFSGNISSTLIAEAGIKIADKYYPTTTTPQAGGTFDGCTATELKFGNLEVRAYIKDIYGNYYLSAAKTAIITGIPYAVIPAESGANPWESVSGNNIKWVSSGVTLATITGAPSVMTPAFNIPADIATATHVKYTKNTGSLITYIFTVLQYDGTNSGTELVNHKSKSKGTYEFDNTCTMSAQYNRFICKYNYTVTGNDVTVNMLEVKYQ